MRIDGRAVRFVFDNSLLLILGAAAGLVWANVDSGGYGRFLHTPLLEASIVGRLIADGRVLDLHFLVNDVLMAFFFALAGKEVWAALLPGGPLHHPRQAAIPLACAVGGMIGPAVIYIAGAEALGQGGQLGNGWAIPCATDIAFSYLIARIIFGTGHPAISFLLLLAIVDDALGMLILAVFYPQEPLQLAWLLLPAGAIAAGWAMRRFRVHGVWWYLLPLGAASWFGFAMAGLHPALGLLPIVPIIPHARGVRPHTGWDALALESQWDRFEGGLKRPVEVVLGLFGLFNAGVVLGEAGVATLLVTAALLIGKPCGIMLSGLATMRALGIKASAAMPWRDLLVIGCAAGIGFTVSLFVATVAFRPGGIQDSAKLGALASFAAAAMAWAAASILAVGRFRPRRNPSA